MNELQEMKKKNLIAQIEETQNQIDKLGDTGVELGIKQGKYLSQVQDELKDDLEQWKAIHPRKERAEFADTKPLKYGAWCDENVKANLASRKQYKFLYENKEVLKNGYRDSHLWSMRSALTYIRDTLKRLALEATLEAMTDAEKEDYWKKKNEAEDKKPPVKSPVKKTPAAPVATIEVTEAEFIDAVRGYIPKEYQDLIDTEIGNIPDIKQSLFLHSRGQIIASMAGLTKAANRKLITAVAQMATSQALAFGLIVRSKPKYFRDAEARLKRATQALKDKTAKLTTDNVVAPKGSITVEEFKLIRSILHSDKEASPVRKNKAFAIFNRAFGDR